MSREITAIGIIGAGTMGAGIMINGLMSGLQVTLVDRTREALDRARQKLDHYLARQVQKGRLAELDVAALRLRLTTSTDMGALSLADLVIEAVVERLDLKQAVFRDLEDHLRPDAILASNTSCLRLAEIQSRYVAPDGHPARAFVHLLRQELRRRAAQPATG